VNCADFGATIHEFIDGLLPKADADAARAHVASCADCAERVETAKRFARLLVDEGDAAIDAWTAHATVGRALSTDPTRAGALRRAAPFVATAAASIAASVLVALALFSPSSTPPAPETLAEGASVELPRGRHVLAAAGREIESEDSAVIGVVAGSGGERVKIDSGSALFRVEPGRPFAVETPQGVASVLGTSFHVAVTRANEVSVTVHSGRVQFVGAKETATLSPGDRLEVDAHGAQRLIDRRKLDEAETTARRANSKAEAAVASAAQTPPVASPEAIRAFLQTDAGRALLKSAIETAQAKQAEDAANAMHEAAFARFAKAADLPDDVAARAKELLRQFGVSFRELTTPPKDATHEERERFWKDNYATIVALRARLDDDLRNLLTPSQFEVYLRSYPPAPAAPGAGGPGRGTEEKK